MSEAHNRLVTLSLTFIVLPYIFFVFKILKQRWQWDNKHSDAYIQLAILIKKH